MSLKRKRDGLRSKKPSMIKYDTTNGIINGIYEVRHDKYPYHVVLSENYAMGILHGVRKEYDPRTKKMNVYEEYKNGKLHGLSKRWVDGRISYSKNYKDGVQHGKSYIVHPTYKNVTVRQNWSAGILHGETTLLMNNISRARFNYNNGALDGDFDIFNEGSELVESISFENGVCDKKELSLWLQDIIPPIVINI